MSRSLTSLRRTAATVLVSLIALPGVITAVPAHAVTIPLKNAQWDLAALGYLSYTGVDGVDGPKTADALKEFQRDRCLTAGGAVDDDTSAMLSGVIKAVQVRAGVTPADGQAGPDTKTGIAAFQKSHGLTADGVAGADTMGKLGVQRALECPAPIAPCAEGTKDLGVHPAFVGGRSIGIRLCAIPNLPSKAEESTPGSRFYVNGADGHGIFASRVSGQVFAWMSAAKRGGADLTAVETYRSPERFRAASHRICDPRPCPPPQHNLHDAGEAVNFAGLPVTGDHLPTPVNSWLDREAEKNGFYRSPRNPSHWDTTKPPVRD